jgi:hypothetical protein
MPSYEFSKIYTVSSPNQEKIYIGSTTLPMLCQRIGLYRNEYRKWKNGLNYNKATIYDLFDEFGADNCKIALLENYKCTTRDELNGREQYYIDKTECINKFVIGRKIKSQKKDINDILNDQCKEIVLKQREKLTCNCGGRYTMINLNQHSKSKRHIKFLSNPIVAEIVLDTDVEMLDYDNIIVTETIEL